MMTLLSQVEPLPTTLQTVEEFEQWQRYKGTDTLSAAPVIEDFQFVVADLFA